MKIAVEEKMGVSVLTPEDHVLDADNSTKFRHDVAAILESRANVVFDMSAVGFIDSSGCGVLLSCLRKLRDKGGDLKLCGMSQQIRSLFQIIRLDKILDTYDNREDAVGAFQD
ncbi:MAG: STAS domain-containing protein [Desulfatiglandales bacterium]